MRFFKALLPLCGLLLLLCVTGDLVAQARTTANSSSGGAYSRIRSQDFEVESPDRFGQGICDPGDRGDHSSFGNHITQIRDGVLNRNVFEFHSHIDEDSDMCRKFDRVRIEVKGMPRSDIDPEIKHNNGETSYYRFQFKLPSNFRGSTNFSHIFQNKATGGPDDGFPLITISARTSLIEVRHDAGENMNGDKGRMVSADIDRFKGKWVEVYMVQKHSDSGTFYVEFKDMSNGNVIMSHRDNNLDMWRRGATINRPKFGIYRRITDEAKDEKVRFAEFCSSESGASRCPSRITASSGGGALAGTYRFRNRSTGQYLDSDGSGSVKAGTRSNADDRLWRLVRSNASRNDYNIDSRQSGRGVLEATGSSTVRYVSAEPVQTADRREWNPESLGNNIYRFKNRDTGKFLAQKNGGTGIEHTGWNGSRAQWVLEAVSTSLEAPTGFDRTHEATVTENMTVTPNPVVTFFQVSVGEDVSSAELSLFTLDGKRVFQSALTSGQQRFQRPAGLPAGIYIARMTGAEGLIGSQKVIFR